MTFYRVSLPLDILNIPKDAETIEYHIDDKITFEIPKTTTTFLLNSRYKFDLSFIENTNITTLGIWCNHKQWNGKQLLQNIPLQIKKLVMQYICEPLLNLPITLEKISIFIVNDRDLVEKSKIPFGCEIVINEKF